MRLCALLFVVLAHVAGIRTAEPVPIANPVLPQQLADPSIVQHRGQLYLFATKDPWGGSDLACYSTTNFRDWQPHTLTWPTKAACQSKTGTENKVWAPSVVARPGGGFVMFVSIGSEIYCGTAPEPTGPWKNTRADGGPILRNGQFPGVHVIDGEAFVDDDGQAYLYFGSGWDWKDGHCLVAKLSADMTTLTSEPRDITPPNYFEAPFMVKHAGRYYLMYSHGKTIDRTYCVRYAMSDSPLGPFAAEGPNSPILATDEDREVLGPGHHCIFRQGDDFVIAYHRLSRPYRPDTLLREICFDRLTFGADGSIERVQPTDEGVSLAPLSP